MSNVNLDGCNFFFGGLNELLFGESLGVSVKYLSMLWKNEFIMIVAKGLILLWIQP